MDEQVLKQIANDMVSRPKGILAADESNGSANKRLAAVKLPETEETRRQYRQLLFKTPDLNEYINGVILYDETFWQETDEGQSFRDYLSERGIMPGIKVDEGLIDLPGFGEEQLTQGLDSLPDRMVNYAENGAKFAKWRSVIHIGEGMPTNEAIGANTFVLARYARICQENNIVPMVEPEVLFTGNHSIEQTEEVMKRVYGTLFETLGAFRVSFPGTILKTSMVLAGKDTGVMDHEDVANRTSAILKSLVPQELGGVVFLSGGQTPKDAMINLDKIEDRGPYPWGLTFSYSRALQDPVLKQWAEDTDKVEESQFTFKKQLNQAINATKGDLDESQLGNDNFVTEGQN